jgi:N-acetylmuramoyl-L-alanine amidase
MIVLDPGHGGNDVGGRSNGLVEKEITLDVARRTEELLTRSGFTTVLTRKDDNYVSLEDRAAIANSYDDAILVSVHFNLDGSRDSSGVESFYARRKSQPEEEWAFIGLFGKPDVQLDTGEDLAGYVQNAVSKRTNARNRGIRAGNLFVVRKVKCPAVLVEGGFMSNPMEARLLGNGDYRDRMARGIAEGVMTYLKSRPAHQSEEIPQLAKADR